ncbi:MAG: integral rane sensor signal transduction histidine kinase [Marmoricola sp.]|nr:integral rane sensor signal transduction histidine kinase [Marmoricola sp.]
MTSAWSRLSLRARLLLIGVLGVATALALGSVALYGVLTVVGYRTLDASAEATAREVADLVDSNRLPDPIPVTGNQIVQVVDSSDRVVSASVNADRLSPILQRRELSAALSGDHPVVPGSRVGRDSALRVTAVAAGRTGAPRKVVVAQPFEDIEDSQRVLRTTLFVTYPLLLVVLALIASRVIAAALRPVDSLRATADRISGAGQDTRLPVPESRDEIHDLAVTLNSMLDRLAAARARQRSFVADAAHELRSPLASMVTQLDAAEHLGESTEVTDDLRAEVDRMVGLVEGLLVLARLDREAPLDDPPGTVDLPLLVADAVRRHQHARVSVATAVPDLLVSAHEDGLRRVLDNVLANAVRHASTSVTVTASGDDGTVRVIIEDDGAGIRPEDRDRVFDRFTRLDEARDRDSGGSGLGLAIVRELVERDAGSVTLGTGHAGGLQVVLSLPAGEGSGDGIGARSGS